MHSCLLRAYHVPDALSGAGDKGMDKREAILALTKGETWALKQIKKIKHTSDYPFPSPSMIFLPPLSLLDL